MKKLAIILIALCVVGCGEDTDPTPDTVSLLITDVYMANSTDKSKVSMFHFIFDAEGKDFEVRDYSELVDGYAYDKLSDQTYKYISRSVESDGRYIEQIDPGQYFVVVILSDEGQYSHTNVTVTEGQDTEIEKVFKNNVLRFSYEPW